jgi:hypothetical protein
MAGLLGHLSLAGMSYCLLGLTAVSSAAGAVLGSWLVTDKLHGRQVTLLIGIVRVAIAGKMALSLI